MSLLHFGPCTLLLTLLINGGVGGNFVVLFLALILAIVPSWSSLVAKISLVYSIIYMLVLVVFSILTTQITSIQGVYEDNSDVFEGLAIFSFVSHQVRFFVCIFCALITIAAAFMARKPSVGKSSFKLPGVSSLLLLWGAALGISAILIPCYLLCPQVLLYLIVIGLFVFFPSPGSMTRFVSICSSCSTIYCSFVLTCLLLWQNPAVSSDYYTIGLVNLWTAVDHNFYAIRRCAQMLLLFITILFSHMLVAQDSGSLHVTEAGGVTIPWLRKLLGFIGRYRNELLQPAFALICVVGPSVLSGLLMILVCANYFVRLDRITKPLYIYCSFMSIAVYIVNVEPVALGTMIRIIIANPMRDGEVIPLVTQCAVAGLVAVSHVIVVNEFGDADDSVERKVQRVSASLDAMTMVAVAKEWEDLNQTLSSEPLHGVVTQMMGGSVEAEVLEMIDRLCSFHEGQHKVASPTSSSPEEVPMIEISSAASDSTSSQSVFYLIRYTQLVFNRQIESIFGLLLLSLRHLYTEYNMVLTLLFLFVAATSQPQLDALHIVLLLFFVGFLSSIDLMIRFCFVLQLYLVTMITVLFFTFVFAEVIHFTTLMRIIGLNKVNSQWAFCWYLATLFLASAGRRISQRLSASLKGQLVKSYMRKLQEIRFAVLAQSYSVMFILGVVLILRIVFEHRSVVLVGYCVLLLTMCFMATYMPFWQARSKALWMIGAIYSLLSMCWLSAYQIVSLHDEIEKVFVVGNSSKCVILCKTEVGLRRPVVDSTTALLFPSCICVNLFAFQLIFLPRIRKILNQQSAAVVLGKGSPLTSFYHFAHHIGIMIWRHAEKLVWVSHFFAAAIFPSIANGIYLLFFIMNLCGKIPIVFSALHLLISYIYQFESFPVIFGSAETARFAGFVRVERGNGVSFAVGGPALVFVCALLYESSRGWGPQNAKFVGKENSEKQVILPSFSWWQRLWFRLKELISLGQHHFVRQISLWSFEIVILLHLIGAAASVRRLVGFLHLLLVGVLDLCGRSRVQMNGVLQTSLHWASTLIILAQYFLSIQFPASILDASSPLSEAAVLNSFQQYVGFRAPISDLIFVFLLAVSYRLIETDALSSQQRFASLKSEIGYFNCIDLLRDRQSDIDAAVKNGDMDELDRVLATKKETAHLSAPTWLIKVVIFTVPPATLSFFDGIGRTSIINLIIVVSGLLMLGHYNRVLLACHVLWPRWEKFCVAFAWLVALCNIPPVAEALSNFRFAEPLGLIIDGKVIHLSAVRIVLLFAVFLQRRAFEETSFASIFGQLHKDGIAQIALHEAVRKAQMEEEQENINLANRKMAERQNKLKQIWAARRQNLEKGTMDDSVREEKETEEVKTCEEEERKENDGMEDWVIPLVGKDTLEDDTSSPPQESQRTKFLNEIISYLSRYTYTRKEPDQLLGIRRRLLAVIARVIKRHTAEICCCLFTINFVSSGTLYDSIPSLGALLYAFLVTPWPGPTYWDIALLYNVFGIVLKSCFGLLQLATPIPDGTKRTLAFLLYDSGDVKNHSALIDLLGDFFVFGMILVHKQVAQKYGIIGQHTKLECFSPTEFLRNVLRIAGCGADYYTLFSLVDVLALIIGALNYYDIAGLSQGSFVESVRANLLPGPLVLAMLISVIFIIIDRIFYLTRSMKSKLVMHFFQVVLFHVAYVIWRHQFAVTVLPGSMYLLFKCIYFIITSIQIRKGFPRFCEHDPFRKHPEKPWYVFYYVYRFVPFLWELRSLLDWCATATTLKFDYWFKLEDVSHQLHLRYIDIEQNRETNPKPGTLYPVLFKFAQGGLSFICVVFVLFFPLMYYSTFNPGLQFNRMTSFRGDFSFGTITRFYRGEADIPDFETERSSLPVEFGTWVKQSREGLIEMQNFDPIQQSIQLVSLPSCSSELWMISPYGLQKLLTVLRKIDVFDPNVSSVSLRTTLDFDRLGGTANANLQQQLKMLWSIPLEIGANISIAGSFSSGTASFEVPLPKFYIPFIFNRPNGAELLGDMAPTSCILNVSFTAGSSSTIPSRYCCLRCAPLFADGNLPSAAEKLCFDNPKTCSLRYDKNPPNLTRPLQDFYFVVLSDKVPTESNFLPNVGIIALYTTFIFALSRVLRGFLEGSAFRVVLEDLANPHQVAELVEYIYLSRAEGRAEDLVLEEQLYFELIDLLRAPDALQRVTGLRTGVQDADMPKVSVS